MTDQHPITPPPELVEQWEAETAHTTKDETWHVAVQAARWGADQQLKLDAEQIAQAYTAGADQELEACCDHSRDYQWGFVDRPDGTQMHRAVDLELARRPKPPSLNKVALQMLGTIERDAHYLPEITDTIRRALEGATDE